ncbi:MAG: hypothetical protein FJX62_07645 [Alphaproteobacteria bacterium]|nr:hypothetical protein [Alphaproteobacteria bacterium]
MNPYAIGQRAVAALAIVLTCEAAMAQPAPAQSAPRGTAPAAAAKPDAVKPAAATPGETAAKPEPHVFAIMAGSWSGGGTIVLSSGTRERLRCRARHSAGRDGKSLNLSIRCASDSYRFDLSSNVVERRGRIFGSWQEASNGVSSSVSGSAAGNRVRAVATSDLFTAGLALTTQGDRQSVSITPRGVHITGVHIALRKH